MINSAKSDPELRDWLRWQSEHGSSFGRTLAEAMLIADLRDYNVLRPALLELKRLNPVQKTD